MAAYGAADFVSGSELSDLSDFSEEEFDTNDLEGFNSEFEDEGGENIKTYCVCGQPETTAMIACDNDQCKIEWYHYECVGLTSTTIPNGSWICRRCLPQEQGHSEIAVAEVNIEGPNNPAPSEDFTEFPTSSSVKKTTHRSSKKNSTNSKKERKKAPNRPEAKYKESDAMSNATHYVVSSLKRIMEHPVFRGPYPNAVCAIVFITTLLRFSESPEFAQFCTNTVMALWLIVSEGNSKKLKPEGNEIICRSFYHYRLTSLDKWNSFVQSLGLETEGQHVTIVYQFMLQTVLTLMITERNKMDMPDCEKQELKPLDKNEEQVLRYVAGYVPYALSKRFKKQTGETAKVYCKFLHTWEICGTNSVKTFLAYTEDWIRKQNRGGLFSVSDEVYIFFRTLEDVNRKCLTTDQLDRMPGTNIQSIILNKMLENPRVHTYWCNLTRNKITGNASKKLLDIVVKLWIKIRTRAYVKVYLDLKKANKEKISLKGEKALRRDL